MTKSISVLGAGGHAKVVISLLRSLQYKVEAIYDDNSETWKKSIAGVPVVGATHLLAETSGKDLVIAVGDNLQRKVLAQKLSQHRFESYIHPSAVVDASVKIGKGTVVFAGAVVQADTDIGEHVIVNTSASIDHDCVIESFSHIAPGVHLAGGVTIREGALCGIGSLAIPGAEVEAWSLLKAGELAKSKSKVVRTHQPLSLPLINDEDISAVVGVLKSGRLSLGPEKTLFEKNLSEYLGVKHCVAVSSGTAALHLIVKSLGLLPGDEVLVPSFTFVASVNALLYEGLVPVFVDIEEKYYCLSMKDLEAKITKRTKAVMAVDVFGHPVDWPALQDIAKRYNLQVIDDACEALGAEFEGRKLGTFGEAAAFAFYPNKQITAGEGGVVATDSEEIAESCRILSNQGRALGDKWLHHEKMGYNYRIDEMSAALANSQLKRLQSILDKRAQLATLYKKHLERFDWLTVPEVSDRVQMSWFCYVIRVSENLNRDKLVENLNSAGIESRAYFPPVHLQPYIKKLFSEANDLSLPITERVSGSTLALPFYLAMGEEDIKLVCEKLNSASYELVKNQSR